MEKNKRKEAVMAYMETDIPKGIFMIRNQVNGNGYIGSTQNLRGAENSNFFQLRMGVSRNKELQNEWNEFGESNFSFEVVDLLKKNEESPHTNVKNELAALLAIWIEKLEPKGKL